MKLIPIDQNNIVHACQIQHLLFPQENCFADRDYENGYLYPERGMDYWLLEVDGAWVGIAGIYNLKVEPETAWLAWFGILPEYRRRGYATEAIRMFEDVARSRGYLYARLFTERADAAAIACYLHNGFFQEEYNCPTDPGAKEVLMYIMSKSLYPGRECPPWNDRDISLWYQFSKQGEMLYG